jgi:5-methylcytosine-specific restriction protein B
MNTADRSIAMVDYALRRRFSFIMLLPQFNTKFEENLSENGFTPELSQKIIQNIKRLNETIRTDINLGEGFQVGHSYFCPDGHGPYNNHWYENKIKYKVEPLLREYWFDSPGNVQSLVVDLNRNVT